MNKLNVLWIGLIVVGSVTVTGGLFYVIYRLYINYIYKRRRAWCEITTPSAVLTRVNSSKRVDEHPSFLIPRQSIIPLVQEYLPAELKRKPIPRPMVTRLQFNDAPLFFKNFKAEWNEMDSNSLSSSKAVSSRTSYYTIGEETACEQNRSSHRPSLQKHLSITSSNEFVTPFSSIEQFTSSNSSQKHTVSSFSFHPLRRSNYIALDMDHLQEINTSENVLQVYKTHHSIIEDQIP